MCGIAGLFLPKDAPQQAANLSAMMAILAHRGPDGERIWVSPDRRYQVGFRRLAIIDLETGDQPILSHGGTHVLVGNGEIYNYLELRATPEAARYPFKTKGDIEVVLPLHAVLGDAFVHRLNGMYALALYDSARHRLLLVRDRLGVKPIYWSRLASGGVVFASEVKALFASGLVTPEVDETSVSAYLAHGYVPSPATLYRGVFKLPPAHMLTAEADGTVAVASYWQARPAEEFPRHPTAMVERLTELLDDAVRLQLRSDVPLGVLLSGGIDSGLVVALAARRLGQPLATYTVRFEGSDVDETPLAAEVARRYSTRHTTFDLSVRSVAEHMPRLAWFCDEPLADASLLPNYLIESVLGREIRVALNGTGGDELFAGYGRYFPLPVERRYMMLPHWLRQSVIEPVVAGLSPMTAWRLKRAEKFRHDRGGYLHDHSTLFPRPMLHRIGSRLSPAETAQRRFFDAFAGPAETAALYADLNTYLPENLLTLLDRTSMAVSVEGRVPFLDHRLVEAALAVPPEVRTPNGRQKGLERTIAARFLPEAVLSAPKQGFASPANAWFRGPLAGFARRLLTRPETLARGWWTAEGIEHLLGNPDRHGHRVYALLMLELAVNLHVETCVRSAPSVGLEAFADAA